MMNDRKAPPAGGFAGPYNWIANATSVPSPGSLGSGGASAAFYTQDEHAIDAGATGIYFTAGGTGQLYLRRNPSEEQSPLDEGKCIDPARACTLHISGSQRTGGADPAGSQPAAFMAASPDGSTALFTSSEKLTDNANTGPELLPPAVARANIDGSGKNLSFLPAHASGVAVDSSHIYWANPGLGTIGRAKLNGAGSATEVNEEFITGADNPRGVAVDGAHVYWTNAADEKNGTGSIGRANLDGSNSEQEFISGVIASVDAVNNPRGIDVDAGHVYWVNGGVGEEFRTGFGNVARANIDGSGVEPEFIPFASGDVAVNATKIYYSRSSGQGAGFIRSANLDGTGVESGPEVSGAEDPPSIALDGSHLYWGSPTTSKIGRSNLDFTAQQEGFIEEADHPEGLALDGSRIYWSANQEGLPNPGNDLYRYNAKTGALTDLTPDHEVTDPNGAEVKGVLGASDDGSFVYFAANGALTPGATPGTCKGSADGSFLNFKGKCNLYLAREGAPIQFVAPLNASGQGAESDAGNWLPHGGLAGGRFEKTARVTPDGRTLLFRSQEQLTPYDNDGKAEFYRFRFGSPGIICVSCNPTGAAAGISPTLASIGLSAVSPPDPALVLSRNLSADGEQVFFESTEALVGTDTNGEEGCPEVGAPQGKYRICLDVYEWEANGAGSCDSEAQGGGCLYLLSTGKSPDASYFADASASGEDAFLITRSPLVGQDEDQLYDVYDARGGGGIASQNKPPEIPCASEEACKEGPKIPPASQSAGSERFHEEPKPKPHCPKNKRKVRSKGKVRCVAKKMPNSTKHQHRNGNRAGRASR